MKKMQILFRHLEEEKFRAIKNGYCRLEQEDQELINEKRNETVEEIKNVIPDWEPQSPGEKTVWAQITCKSNHKELEDYVLPLLEHSNNDKARKLLLKALRSSDIAVELEKNISY